MILLVSCKNNERTGFQVWRHAVETHVQVYFHTKIIEKILGLGALFCFAGLATLQAYSPNPTEVSSPSTKTAPPPPTSTSAPNPTTRSTPHTYLTSTSPLLPTSQDFACSRYQRRRPAPCSPSNTAVGFPRFNHCSSWSATASLWTPPFVSLLHGRPLASIN